jgi:hypothetical protein
MTSPVRADVRIANPNARAAMPSCSCDDDSASVVKVGWRRAEWGEAVGLCRVTVYNLMNAWAIQSVKAGSARIIVTAPATFLARLANDAV